MQCPNVFIAELPQSTAGVKRTFSRLNNNKNKLRDCVADSTLEAIIKSGEKFPVTLKSTKSYAFTWQSKENIS